MRIAACYKNVPDNEKIKLAPDNSLDLSAAAPQIGQYDLNAVEAAVDATLAVPAAVVAVLAAALAVDWAVAISCCSSRSSAGSRDPPPGL